MPWFVDSTFGGREEELPSLRMDVEGRGAPQRRARGCRGTMSGAREHTERVEQLVEMGFARDKAVSALKRANNDIAVAMNFLFDGQDGDGDDEMPALL